VVFVGPTYSFPNRDAVEYLLESIWPVIRGKQSGATLELIGRGTGDDLARYNQIPGVSAPGTVPDIRPHLERATCCAVPIRVGGGTRVKILDAWAMGKAVVSTSIGCEGLAAIDGENILIRDDPPAFADGALQVMADASLRNRLERNARETVVRQFSWDVIGERLRDAYRGLIG
jgi:glycosyltransferase involved in cell wall biosynthesis